MDQEGKYALNWTRLSCHKFVANQVRLGLFVMAYKPGQLLEKAGRAGGDETLVAD